MGILQKESVLLFTELKSTYEVDNDEKEFSFFLGFLVLFKAPDKVGHLDDGGDQHDGRITLNFGNFAEQNIL